ncbi:MAG: hypothetical protein LBU36_03010 [Clostridiales bacterium]|jgi:hypothetical protein|nr:hypothetical protein [Clostridiales bacterium]
MAEPNEVIATLLSPTVAKEIADYIDRGTRLSGRDGEAGAAVLRIRNLYSTRRPARPAASWQGSAGGQTVQSGAKRLLLCPVFWFV